MRTKIKDIHISAKMIVTVVFLVLFVLICSRNIYAEEIAQEEPVPQNGIPLMLIYVDESAEVIRI